MDKQTIRQAMRKRRDSLVPIEMERARAAMERQLFALPEYQKASVIMTYLSFRNEIPTKPLIQRALADKKRIVVPLCNREDTTILPCEIKDLKELVPGTWGIEEPSREHCRRIHPEELDLLIIPGLAFDPLGNRLGYGAGYYDRFLSLLDSHTLKAGFAYDFQIMKRVPTDPHDIPLDCILTETGILWRKVGQEDEDMKERTYRTGEACPMEGLYQCQLSQERQRYKKGDIFDYCPLGKETKWKKIE